MTMFKMKLARLMRFLLGGGTNTAFTYGIYLLFATILDYQLAFLIAYVTGIVFAYWFNSVIVFRVPLSWKGLSTYPLIYLIQYLLSAFFLKMLVEVAKIPQTWAPLWVAGGMLPITFLMNKLVLEWKHVRNNRKFLLD